MQPQPTDTGTTAAPTVPAAQPVPEAPTVSKPLIWVSAILAILGLVATSVLSLGIAVIFWGPAVIVLALAMWGVWGARRRRQLYENRGPDETKNPTHAEHSWPTKGVIDDRLPQN